MEQPLFRKGIFDDVPCLIMEFFMWLYSGSIVVYFYKWYTYYQCKIITKLHNKYVLRRNCLADAGTTNISLSLLHWQISTNKFHARKTWETSQNFTFLCQKGRCYLSLLHSPRLSIDFCIHSLFIMFIFWQVTSQCPLLCF